MERKADQIDNLNAEIQDLSKLNQMLQERQSELKTVIEPRDDAIARMQATLQDMDAELLRDIG